MIMNKIMTYDDMKPGPRGPGLQKTVEVMILGPGFTMLKFHNVDLVSQC